MSKTYYNPDDLKKFGGITEWSQELGEKFFEYGSALIVEIHRSEDKGIRYFILKYKTSESEQAQNIVIHEKK